METKNFCKLTQSVKIRLTKCEIGQNNTLADKYKLRKWQKNGPEFIQITSKGQIV